MAVKVLELHQHAVRVSPNEADADTALALYRDVLGLLPDGGRPSIPGVPGYWREPASGA